jgi:hypothetical protein
MKFSNYCSAKNKAKNDKVAKDGFSFTDYN